MFKKIKEILKTPAQREAKEKAIKAAEEEKQRKAAERKAKRAEEKAKKQEAATQIKTEKDLATERGEPWVQVLSIEVDPENPGAGAFELDWNDIFVARLIKSGYRGKTDQDIVDNWFQDVCRNVVLETWEQEQADPEKRRRQNNRKDLGDGRTEVS